VNALLAATVALARAMTRDPLLLLVSAVATFDPLWNVIQDDDDADPLTIALHITRDAFPDIYAEAVERLRAGSSALETDRWLCGAISAKGIPVDDLERLGWGIPLEPVGIALDEPEFWSMHGDMLPALAPFGIRLPDDDGAQDEVVIPADAYAVGSAISGSLLAQPDAALNQLGWLFAWLFSCSGNSLIDLTWEELAEYPPLLWCERDIAFAMEMIAEADEIAGCFQPALEGLTDWSELLTALDTNITIVRDTIMKEGVDRERIYDLAWPAHSGLGADGAAVAGAELLQLRRDAA
jgi:hypothetical protein